MTMFNRKYIFKGSIFHCHVSLPECNRFNSRRVLVNLEVYRRSSSSTAKAPWYIPATKNQHGPFQSWKVGHMQFGKENIWSQRSSGAKSWIGLRYTKKCRTLNRSTWVDRCYHKEKKTRVKTVKHPTQPCWPARNPADATYAWTHPLFLGAFAHRNQRIKKKTWSLSWPSQNIQGFW